MDSPGGAVSRPPYRLEGDELFAEEAVLYRTAVEAMAEGLVVQDPGGVIRSCNAAAQRILGLTLDQMTGRTSMDPRWRAVHEDGSPFPGETHPAMVTLRTGRPVSGVVMGVHKPDGSLSWIVINTRPVVGASTGALLGVLATFSDITELKRLEREAARLSSELAAALTKALSGYLPICASCKKIREEAGDWTRIEEYLDRRTDARLTHGLCPDCVEEFYGDESGFDPES